MKFSAAAVLAAAAGVKAYSNATYPTSYTTEVVTAVTTYCPEATEITYGTNTYTVTEVCNFLRNRGGQDWTGSGSAGVSGKSGPGLSFWVSRSIAAEARPP